MRDIAISTKLLSQILKPNFQKIFLFPKMAAILNFRIFDKNGKTKNCLYLLNRADRAISAKFLAHRVYMQDTLLNSQKFFLFPKMAAILNFRIFDKNGKTLNCLYLLNRAR